MSNIATATAFEEHLESASGPSSRLGYSTGRNVFGGSELLIAMKCYFDGSEGTDGGGDTWLTLAGFAASDKSWAGFENTWSKMLRNRYPVAPYIHMCQILAAEDPFERVNGWTKPKVLSLVSDAVDLIQCRDSLYPFSCRVNLSARERIINEGNSVYGPERLCAEMCSAIVLDWNAKRKLESVYMFFDRGERFMKPFKDQWLANRTHPRYVASDPSKRVWDIIANIIDADKEREPALQAADMIAWATTRDLADKLAALHDLDEYLNKFNVEHHAIMDEALLREKYTNIHSMTRSLPALLSNRFLFS